VVAALELYLNPVAERRLRRLWDALEEGGVPSLRDLTHGRHRPHLSLVAARALDGPTVTAALHGLPAAPALPLRLDHIGLFRGRVLWLGPVPTRELLDHHAAVHARLAAHAVPMFAEYRPGAWVPHCTLSLRVPHAALPTALRLCLDTLPIEATIVGAAVADHARDQYQPLPV
jgi:2'-5' RNA ligase superfamily